MIKIIGYNSEISGDSNSALFLLKSQPECFDLVITDMNLPHVNCVELSMELLSIKPDLPIILCTGNCEYVTEELVTDAGIKGLLLKPFSLDELKTAITQVLA